MNSPQGAHGSARSAYGNMRQNTRTDREVEVMVFRRATEQLKQVVDNHFADFKQLVQAIYENRRVWEVIMADVASESNRLSKDLRAQIFSLGEFVRQHSERILDGDRDLATLIAINESMIAGLQGNASEGDR